MDCNGLARNWVCFVFFPLCPSCLHGLPHDSGSVKYLRPAVNGWLRCRNRAHPAGPRPDGHGSFRCSTPISLRDSCPVQSAENSRARGAGMLSGPNGNPAHATHLAKNHDACEINLTPYCEQKKPPRGQKRAPSSGLAGDFRHLAVAWQPSRAAMGVFRLMVKSSEL